jgi:hypothetical protein
MDFSVLNSFEKKIMNDYYGLFYGALIKISKNKFGFRFDLNDHRGEDFYNHALNSFIYSIKKFKFLDKIDDKEYERKFINFIYSNITFYLLNFINKNKVDIKNIEHSDKFTDFIRNKPSYKKSNLKISHHNILQKITHYLKDQEISFYEFGMNSEQIKFILNELFSTENYEYLWFSNTKGKKIWSKDYSILFNSVYKKYKNSEINKKGFNVNSFKAFKMKIYPMIKSFLKYKTEEENEIQI